MRAVVLNDHGDVDVLTLQDIPDPAPGPEEVLVEVTGSAMNRADMLQRMGLYPGPPAEFEVPGLEFAGRVTAVGPRVTSRSVGDEVMGITNGGCHAEMLTVHERQTMTIPSTVPLADAAAIPEVFMTAYDALVLQSGLASGQTALVHAGASGVGTAAIQIAKAIGARIVVTASGGKIAACQQLGADLAIDYTSSDFVDEVKAFTGGNGVDVILDVVGGDYLVRNIRCLKVQGKIIQVGVMDGSPSELPLGMLLPKRASITGTVLRSRPIEEKIAVTQAVASALLPRFEDGSLKPVIDSRYALADIAEAHTYMASNANIGKILLDIAS